MNRDEAIRLVSSALIVAYVIENDLPADMVSKLELLSGLPPGSVGGRVPASEGDVNETS